MRGLGRRARVRGDVSASEKDGLLQGTRVATNKGRRQYAP
jgi:hypothetical protein